MHQESGPVTITWSRQFPGLLPCELFELVRDIESYPLFVPGCIETHIIRKHEDHWIVDNLFGFGPIRARFTTRATFSVPAALDIHSTDGPWRRFQMAWRFLPESDHCRVDCQAHLHFRSPVVAGLAGMAVSGMQASMVEAFEGRARTLLGGGAGDSARLSKPE